uniref:T cell receptor alpha variable 4 n=1 Tax=Marmota marmota marmota TaxID=9994 RepID=A0A8C5ZK46_MARMA
MRQVIRVTLFLILGTLSLAKTTQRISMDAYEGQEVNISCNHTNIATNEYIFWYRQVPHQGPHFVIQGYKTNVANEVASLFIPVDRKSSTLSLHRVTLKDSAVYYCTVGGTVRQLGVHLCSISVGESCSLGRSPEAGFSKTSLYFIFFIFRRC